MTSREDFKQAIRAGNINEAFLVAMSNAPELNITTKIITAADNPSQGDNTLRTHISLIEGKVENEIGERLTGDRYSEIKQFHLEQVTQGHQTIQHNLISLQKMFQLMSAFQEQDKHLSWVDIAADVTREPLSSRQTNKLQGQHPREALAGGVDSGDSQWEDEEPQLPSFAPGEEDEELVDDLLSIADLDDDEDEADSQTKPGSEGDWGDWLEEEESAVKPQVFDLKSLNIRQAEQKWQNWQEESPDSQPADDTP